MREGLMWFNDNPKLTLAEKVQQAVKRYVLRLGKLPDTCCVNAATTLEQDELLIVDKDMCMRVRVRLLHGKYVRPDNFWVGCAEPVRRTEAIRGRMR